MGNSPAAEDTLSNVVSFSFFIIAQSAVCSLKGERSFARWRRSFSNLFFFQKFICSKESYCYSHIYPFFFVQFCNGIDGNLFFFFLYGYLIWKLRHTHCMNSFPCSILYSRVKGCRSVIIYSHLFLKIQCVCVVLQLFPKASITPLDPVSSNKWINGIFPVRIPIEAMYWCCAILNITHN